VSSVLKPSAGVPRVSPLRPHSVYSSLRWLTVRELDGCAPYAYATGMTEGSLSSPAGLLPIYDRTSTSPTTSPRYHVSQVLQGMPSNSVSDSSCFAGAMTGFLSDLPTMSSANEETAAKALLTSAQEIAGMAESLIFPYITTATASLITNVCSARILLQGVDAWLDVPSSSFEEYVESLQAPARADVRRDFSAFHQAGLTACIEPLSDCMNSFAPLAVQNCLKYGLDCSDSECGMEANEENHLHNIVEIFDDDAVVFAARHGDRLVGGALGLIHEDAIYLRELGFDYSAVNGSHAYFVLSFHLPRRYAADNSLKRIHHGLTVDRTKRIRGSLLYPLWTALINAKSTDSSVDLLNSKRLSELSEVIGTSQTSRFMDEVKAVTGLK
jgi:Peptidogalycan biosysnthesis/recognition